MTVLAFSFFLAAIGVGLWSIVASLVGNHAAIMRALRMELPADLLPTPPAARVIRVRHVRQRAAAAAPWRAAA